MTTSPVQTAIEQIEAALRYKQCNTAKGFLEAAIATLKATQQQPVSPLQPSPTYRAHVQQFDAPIYRMTVRHWNSANPGPYRTQGDWVSTDADVLVVGVPEAVAIEAAHVHQKCFGVAMPPDYNVSLCGKYLYDLEEIDVQPFFTIAQGMFFRMPCSVNPGRKFCKVNGSQATATDTGELVTCGHQLLTELIEEE